MKINYYYLIGLLFFSFSIQIEAQNDSLQNATEKHRVEKLELEVKTIKDQEKEGLKQEVEAINLRLKKGEITKEEAEALKMEMAKKRALNIENRVAILENRIELASRNGEVVFDSSKMYQISPNRFFGVKISNREKAVKYDKRTSSQLTFASGFNTAIIDNVSLSDSPYSLNGKNTGFTELGWSWSTRVLEHSNAIRFKYGFTFQWNKLSPKDNRYFVNENSETLLKTSDLDFNKPAKLITTNLVFPLFLEFGPSKKIEKDTYFRYSTYNKFKFGIGGYAGFNIGARQKLYYEDNGHDIKQKIKGNYNVNSFVYGVSSYIAWGSIGIYAKYDLSPLFENATIKQNNLSLGLRFDMD